MKKITNYKFLFVFVLFVILALLFPLVGRDLYWASSKIVNFKDFLNLLDGGILNSAFLILLSKFKWARVVTYGVLSTAMFVLIRNVVNKKNDALMFMAMFFFVLHDKIVFASSYASLVGFTEHFLGSIFLILFINALIKNSFSNKGCLFLLIFGLLSSSISIRYSFIIFVVSLGYFIWKYRSGIKDKNLWALIVGEIVGLVGSILLSKFNYDGLIYNLLYGFIPKVSGTNFLILLILSALILLHAIKLFNKGKQLGAILAIFGVSSFLFSSLLTSFEYLNYITYVLYFVSSFYILYNFTNSKLFKYRVTIYYTFKFLFILSLCLFGGITDGSTLFLYLVDIILILELYNHIFPVNFLSIVWVIISVLMMVSYIYVYHNVANKYNEMNFYVKNRLECYFDEFYIPEKYRTDYLYDYIPSNRDNFEIYVMYYDISTYNKEIQKLQFNNNPKE